MMYLFAALFAIGASLFVSETEARALCTLIVEPATGKALVREGDCATRGLKATGFATVDLSSGGKTLRFTLPR